SVMMSRTFGAPLGALTPVGKSDLDSLALRPMRPPNGASGTGRMGEPPVGGFSTGLSWAERLAGGPLATSQPSRAPAAAAAVRVDGVRIVSLQVRRDRASDVARIVLAGSELTAACGPTAD